MSADLHANNPPEQRGRGSAKLDLEYVLACAQGDASTGFCLACGHEQDGCEPDARGYECEACGAMRVYGAEGSPNHARWTMSDNLQPTASDARTSTCTSTRRAYNVLGEVNGAGPSGRVNARLIAAAPDLLAACQTALIALTHIDSLAWHATAIADIRAAIARAEGGAP